MVLLLLHYFNRNIISISSDNTHPEKFCWNDVCVSEFDWYCCFWVGFRNGIILSANSSHCHKMLLILWHFLQFNQIWLCISYCVNYWMNLWKKYEFQVFSIFFIYYPLEVDGQRHQVNITRMLAIFFRFFSISLGS